MGREICLDSDILIDLLRGDKKVKENLSLLDANISTTSISLFEVWYGKKEKEDIESVLNLMNIFPLDAESAKLSAEILLKLEKNGEALEFKDIFIASICISNNLDLLTNNKKHFERLKKFGLNII